MSGNQIASPWILLRLVAAALLALALWNPNLPGGSGPRHLVLLVDDSASMRREQVDNAWRNLAPAISDLPAGSLLSLIRFGAEPRLELARRPISDLATAELLAQPAPQRSMPLTDYQTDIGAALELALTQARGEMPATALIVSDGAANRGDVASALEIAGLRNLTVLWRRPEVSDAGADAWIEAFRAPHRVLAGESFRVTLTLAADRPIKARIELHAGGTVLARQEIELNAAEPQSLSLDVTLNQVGVSRLTANLTAPGDSVPGNNERSLLVATGGLPKVLVISPQPSSSAVGASLSAGGWPVTLADPSELPTGILVGHRVLVLEQIGTADLAPSHWQEIDRAVRRDGLGLVLLGGPGTFGPGGYRHSLLEGLLPLLSEAPPRLPPAAVLFAVDKSGSMDRQTRTGATRMQLARQAVKGSARHLAAADLAGLVMFDRGVTEMLPLGRHADPAAAMAGLWRSSPGGGTALTPALERALRALTGAPVEQRLLVLISDGRFADGAEAQNLSRALESAGIDVISLAIGAEADTSTLEPLSSRGAGRLLRVTDVAELPALMQTEIGARRSAVETGTIAPRAEGPLPFLTPAPRVWPAVRAYPVTRLRPGAEVHLETPGGDPLLASHHAGSGRVVALPAGLGPWAPEWQRWEHWGRFLGGLVQWTSAAAADPGLEIRAESEASSLKLLIDAAGELDWARTGTLSVDVRDPARSWHRFSAQPVAPGRYELEIPAPQTGRYDIRAGTGSRSAGLELWHQPLEELLHRTPEQLAALREQGLVRSWSPRTGISTSAGTGWPAGPAFTALALGLYLLSLLVELAPWRTWIDKLSSRFGNFTLGAGTHENR